MKSQTWIVFALSVVGLCGLGRAAEPAPDRNAFQTLIKVSDLDPAAYADWVDGRERTIEPTNEKDRIGRPQGVIWTQTTVPTHVSREFGNTKTPGVRHLRIGFMEPKPVGAVLVAGDVALSVLKPDAAYPGDLADNNQWLPAQRLDARKTSSAAAPSPASAHLWVLPAGTQTRALRFTHTAQLADREYQGSLGGVYLLSGCYANLAPLAQTITRSSTDKAARLTNGNTDGFWGVWENIASRTGERSTTIADDPEWLMLAWPEPVALSGTAFIFPGFETIEIQAYTGPATTHPRDAAEGDWQSLRTVSGFRNHYPTILGVTWVDFGATVTTRALRVRMTAATIESRECLTHLKGNTNKGKRVWLGEILALHDLAGQPLEQVIPAQATVKPTPDLIPVTFTLPEEGLVTLVIEDKDGKRVRNLVAETPFPKGQNTAWWDGTDDLGRDLDAAKHGLYRIPARLVAPGDYRVRGLWRKPVQAIYEFGIYNDGNPPWGTEDHTGAWLANHSPPQAAAFVPAERSPTGEPAVFLGCYVTEGPDGLAWVDLEGRKRGGKKWIGGNWTAAPFLATDNGPQAVSGVYAYVASVWETGKKSGVNELRVTALTKGGDQAVIRHELSEGGARFGEQIGGLAVQDAILAVSLTATNRILFINARDGQISGELQATAPRGLAYDAQGRLLVLSARQLLRYATPTSPVPQVVIADGLEDPVGLTLDARGTLYISDRGTSHQVKVFTPDGPSTGSGQAKFLRAIGKPGVPKAGPYDPLHMNNPRGLAVDSNRHLWVTEEDYLPKRVSVWTLDDSTGSGPAGSLVKAFYGPSKYGGGGALDSHDKTRFYYAEEGHGVLEFRLDWEKGASALSGVLYRQSPGDLKLPFRSAAPETAFYREINGQPRRYFANCFNSSPTSGHSTGFLFVERDSVLHPVAGMGRGSDWKDLFQREEFAGLVPEGLNIKGDPWKNPFFFIWSDRNGDGHVQPDEMQTRKGPAGGITVLPDLSFCVSRLGEAKGPAQAVRFAPEFADGEVPAYDLAKGQTLLDGVSGPASSGGDQVLVDNAGNVVVTLGSRPFAQHSISGGSNGVATWSYPNPWPGLHASHEAARPTQPGQVIGATRLLGGMFTPGHSDAGALWAVNGNMGNLYLFTSDGLFVATIFKDVRQGKLWKMPVQKRGMSLEGITLHDENFWPTISQTPEGQVYLVDGANTCLVRLDGLETIRRIPPMPLVVTADALRRAHESQLAAEAQRKAEQGGGVLHVASLATPPVIDGRVDDWPNTWVEIDRSGVGANFNSDSKPYDLRGAVAVANGSLFAAWQTDAPNLLLNSGEMPVAPFKTGGTLELMIGTDPASQPDRRTPVGGDIRLLVTQVKDPATKLGTGKTLVLLYRPVAPGSETPKVPFSSPWRTIEFDRVDDISKDVQFAADGKGNYEIAVPLTVLGLNPKPGMRIRGDIGILRGDGHQTVARTYWSNKATSIVSDVPSEAELTPWAWGTWEF